MSYHQYGILVLLMVFLNSCGVRKPVIKTIPIREVTTTELQEVTLTADSTELRLVLECSPFGVPSVRQIGGASGGTLQMDWQLEEDDRGQPSAQLKVRATKPPETLHLPTTTTTKEVPIEVTKTEYRLATWHRWLIGLALLVLFFNTLRYYLHSW